jgi:hypothetical protein
MGAIDNAVLDHLLNLPATGRPVSCFGPTCALADAPAAERRQHEAEVTHWFPSTPCEYVYDELPVTRQIEFLVALFRKGDEQDTQTVQVTALNGLHAMDAAEVRNPGWTATAAISAESA